MAEDHLLLLLDDSGSMEDIAEKVQDAFNTTVRTLGMAGRPPLSTFVLFGSSYQLVRLRERISPKELALKDYSPASGTQFYLGLKAILGTIEQGDRVLLIAFTDGASGDDFNGHAAAIATALRKGPTEVDVVLVCESSGSDGGQYVRGLLEGAANDLKRTAITNRVTLRTKVLVTRITKLKENLTSIAINWQQGGHL